MRQVFFYFSLCFLLLTSPSLFSQSLNWTTFDTGSNMSILLNLNSFPTILGNNLATGDNIGVFYTDDSGDLQCGGFTTWNGDTSQAISFAAYADDTNTPATDGFDDGDSLIWRVRTLIDNVDYEAEATYTTTTPFTDAYDEDGFGQVTNLSIIATAINGCTDPDYLEYNATANVDDGSCLTLIVEGCTNSNFLEYNPNANVDDGSCQTWIIEGCTDADYLEYNAFANVDNGSCLTLVVLGCTDTNYLEFNPNANTDDGSCQTLLIEGCIDAEAQNYNPNANVDNGSCDYSCDPGFVTISVAYTTTDDIEDFSWYITENFVIFDEENSFNVEPNQNYIHHYCVTEGAAINFIGDDLEGLQIINCDEEIPGITLEAQFIAGCNVGLEELNPTAITLSPNPATNTIEISWETTQQELSIVDALGRMVMTVNVSNTQSSLIDIASLEPGMYFIQLTGQQKSTTTQFIKK